MGCATTKCGAVANRRLAGRTVKLVVPYPPGALGDTVARLLGDELQKSLGQSFIVENQPGAGGNVGAAAVARSPADGHALLIAATNNLVINQYLYPNMAFDPLAAFDAVSILVDVPAVVFINAEVPAKTVAEFIAHAKANHGKLNYGSPSAGTTPHLAAEVVNKRHGLAMSHVSFRGAAPAITGLIRNDVQLVIIGAGVGTQYVQGGQLRALAASGDTPMAILPGLPLFRDVGLGDIDVGNWWALAAPAGTPKPIIDKLNAAVRSALNGAIVKPKIEQLGAVVVASSAEGMARQLPKEAAYWAKVVQETGAKPQQ